MNNVVTVCCNASTRSQRRTLFRLSKIREAKSEEGVVHVSRQWEAFDSALLQGVMQCAATSLKRELLVKQERCIATGVPFAGFQALWLMLARFKVDYGHALQIDTLPLVELPSPCPIRCAFALPIYAFACLARTCGALQIRRVQELVAHGEDREADEGADHRK